MIVHEALLYFHPAISRKLKKIVIPSALLLAVLDVIIESKNTIASIETLVKSISPGFNVSQFRFEEGRESALGKR